MAKPLAGVDWEFIKTLYVQGLNPKAISERTGVKRDTIRARANYHSWIQLRETTVPFYPASRNSLVKRTQKALAEASQMAQDAFSREIHAQVAVLERQPPRKLADLANTRAREGRASVVNRLVTTAEKLYGWSGNTQAPALNLTQINFTSADDRPAGAKVIDVPYE